MLPWFDRKIAREFDAWCTSSRLYRPREVPHGIDTRGVLRALYRYRGYAHGTLIDLGCGTKRYAEVFKEHADAYVGIDLYGSDLHKLHSVDVYADATLLPFGDRSVDTVLTTQLLGLIYDHARVLSEACRVLRQGGCLILSFSQKAGGGEEFDYYRFTPAYYRRAISESGLVLDVLETRVGTLGMIGESISNWIYYRGPTAGITGKVSRTLCHLVQQVFGWLDDRWFDPGDALGHIVIAHKP